MDNGCRHLQFGSLEQLKSIELRRDVLRKPLGLDFVRQDLDEESDQYHMAYMQDGEVAGILLLKPAKEKGIIKMRQVAVRTDMQGQGIGNKLVRFSEQWAREHQYRRIELHARKTAVDFYLGMGYQATGVEFEEVGIPHLKMFKDLEHS